MDQTDSRAAQAGLPPVDGVNMWPYLSGAVNVSPRTEIFADAQPFGVLLKEMNGRKWKLFKASSRAVAGSEEEEEGRNAYNEAMRRLAPYWHGAAPTVYTGGVNLACWAGPEYPNSTSRTPHAPPGCNTTVMLGEGLLYDLDADPGEYANLRESNYSQFTAMAARLDALQPTFFNPKRTGDPESTKAFDAATAHGGFWCPFVFP